MTTRVERDPLGELRVPAGSCAIATFMAARTSGGRLVEVWTTSETMLSKNDCIRPV